MSLVDWASAESNGTSSCQISHVSLLIAVKSAGVSVRPKGEPFRAFVCTTINDFGLPAKDRSGRLSMIEPAHLWLLMAKIRAPRPDGAARLNFDLPAAVAAPNTPTTKGA